ncbi:MAG TPA: phosphopantothenoylcysteine decarboxylase [Planctomycetota bacterium]|nr:phosphopantothenoylcysteine decarboxylase [Planctomycetota bacterium]
MKKPKIRFLFTAGPTVEPLDPVRFISNRASGTLGFALAKAAVKAGHRVRLVHGPVSDDLIRAAPKKVALLPIRTAEMMRAVVFECVKTADIVIMNAAVADFQAARFSAIKIKKKGSFLLKLKPTRDILKELGRYKRAHKNLVLIGFALETGSGRTPAARRRSALKSALHKLESKNLDAIILNSPGTIGARSGDFLLIQPGADPIPMPGTKEIFAKKLVRFAAQLRLTKERGDKR